MEKNGPAAGSTNQKGEQTMSHRFVSFGIVLAAAVIAWALFVGPAPDAEVTVTVADHHHPPIAAHLADHIAKEQRARTDMLVHAARLGMAVEAEGEFGVRPGFDPDWDLYYSVVSTADGAVTLYAAVYRANPAVRYLAVWHHLEPAPSPWHLVNG
jgi:hypothetical protein